MQIYEETKTIDPILIFSNLSAGQPYLIRETKDIIVICVRSENIVVLTSELTVYGHIHTHTSINDYADDVGLLISELTFLDIELTGLSYK